MLLAACELCNVLGVELHDVSELNCWPASAACAPCKSGLLADDDDPCAGDRWPESTGYQHREGLIVCRVYQLPGGWYRAELVTADGSESRHIAVREFATKALIALELQGMGPYAPADDFTREVFCEVHPTCGEWP